LHASANHGRWSPIQNQARLAKRSSADRDPGRRKDELMTVNAVLDDTVLASLISSKICHDLAGQIGAINNGLELLEEEIDEDTRYYALELIHNSAKAAWAQLDFHRMAFGASTSLGAEVPLAHIEQVARRYVENGKRRLHWQAEGPAEMVKAHARLLLAMIALSLPALPAGGDIYVGVSGGGKAAEAEQGLGFIVLCRGRSARIPERTEEILSGQNLQGIDSRFILPYYAARLASEAGMPLTATKDGADVLFTARLVH
jgi:histidine phosphotransferase ChpT